MKKRLWKMLLCLCLVISVLPLKAYAATPYTHQVTNDKRREVVYSRDVYEVTEQITATTLGIEKMSGITDIYCAKDGTIYVLCGEESRVIVLDSEYQLIKELELRKKNGSKLRYSGAQGIYVNEDGLIYLADTMNNRVLVLDTEGVVSQEIKTPVADVIPEDFYFQPTKVVEDDEGYLYVLSMGCYNGILLYSDELEFLGFYGASEVESTILDTLSYIWELLTSNDEKKSQQAKTLPYTAIDIAIDEEGYVYTCTSSGSITEQGKGQLRKVSPGGSNILARRELNGKNVTASNYNFFEEDLTKRLGKYRAQQVAAVDVNSSGYIYALDSTYGKIYMYDKECQLITVFGGGVGSNSILGTFANPTAMVVQENNVLIADAKSCSITVFQLTDFGNTLLQAQELFYKSDYVGAKPYWEEIIAQDGNNRLAYKGLARAYYTEGDMSKALTYAEKGMDYVIYDYAHQDELTAFVTEHFAGIFLVVVALIIAIIVLLIKIRKRETPMFQNNPKMQSFSSVLFHPFQAFYDVKYKKTGSVKIAVILTLLLTLSSALADTYSGFLFCTSNAENYNVLFTIAQTAGLLLVWSVVNWAVCSVMNGKGQLKDIYVVSAYAMLPLIIYEVVFIGLSQVMTLDSAEIMTSIHMIVLIYAFFLLSVGMMTIHEYDFKKFILTSIVTCLLIFLVVFIGFILVILLQQFGNFLYSLFMEVVYR